jgi:hypothetical protein
VNESTSACGPKENELLSDPRGREERAEEGEGRPCTGGIENVGTDGVDGIALVGVVQRPIGTLEGQGTEAPRSCERDGANAPG